MLFNSPLSPAKADQLVQLLDLPPNSQVLDAGCGTGEFLLRVLVAYPAHGLGIDRDAQSITAARESAGARGLVPRCEFRTADINDVPIAPASFDLAICIGATHAFGSGDAAFPNTLHQLSRAVRPSGLLLLGEPYWKQPPAPEYLEIIGDPVGIYRDHPGNISLAERHGLLPLYATTSNDDEWDHFEWSHQQKIQRLADANPTDSALIARLTHSKKWRDAYLRWGRSTMGFGFYLFRTLLGDITAV